MNNSLGVCGGQAPGHLQRKIYGFAQRKRSPLQAMPQSLTLKQLRHNVGDRLVRNAYVINS